MWTISFQKDCSLSIYISRTSPSFSRPPDSGHASRTASMSLFMSPIVIYSLAGGGVKWDMLFWPSLIRGGRNGYGTIFGDISILSAMAISKTPEKALSSRLIRRKSNLGHFLIYYGEQSNILWVLSLEGFGMCTGVATSINRWDVLRYENVERDWYCSGWDNLIGNSYSTVLHGDLT